MYRTVLGSGAPGVRDNVPWACHTTVHSELRYLPTSSREAGINSSSKRHVSSPGLFLKPLPPSAARQLRSFFYTSGSPSSETCTVVQASLFPLHTVETRSKAPCLRAEPELDSHHFCSVPQIAMARPPFNVQVQPDCPVGARATRRLVNMTSRTANMMDLHVPEPLIMIKAPITLQDEAGTVN